MTENAEKLDMTPKTLVTLRKLRKMVAEGEKIPVLTCYDATTARWLARGGVGTLLVGDSAAQMILGYDQSIFAPFDFMLQITAGVKRGAPTCFVIGDMPFMSYQAGEGKAIENAGRFLTDGMADAIKMEVNGEYAELVGKMSRAGIPVIAHIGWCPQRIRIAGIRTALLAGKTADEATALVALAEEMEQSGAVMLLVEQCPAEVSERIVEKVSIPVIGCGAGPACDGHVIVLQDLLGMSEFQPSFAKSIEEFGSRLVDVSRRWVEMVGSGEYVKDHPYKMSEGEIKRFTSG